MKTAASAACFLLFHCFRFRFLRIVCVSRRGFAGRKAVSAFLSKIPGGIQISVTLMPVLTVKAAAAVFHLSTAFRTHRTDMVLLRFQNVNACLPCFVLQFFPYGCTKLNG